MVYPSVRATSFKLRGCSSSTASRAFLICSRLRLGRTFRSLSILIFVCPLASHSSGSLSGEKMSDTGSFRWYHARNKLSICGLLFP